MQIATAQKLTRVNRDLAEGMLNDASTDVRKNYYDPKLHGLDWDALVLQAKANIDKAPEMADANAQIAGLLESLNDSHTRFFPPRYDRTVDYGWKFQIIGKNAFITSVDAKSDAASKGMRVGDQLLTLNGFTVDRNSAPGLLYAMYVIAPAAAVTVDLLDPSHKLLHFQAVATIKKTPGLMGLGDESWYLNQQRINFEGAVSRERVRYVQFGSDLMILQIPAFALGSVGVRELIDRARACKTLLIDLRGNPGGAIDSLKSYLAELFNYDVLLGQWVARNKTIPIVVKGDRKNAYTGDLIVLVDSRTASAGEIFARTIQLEQRGTILGDHTSGRTMESQMFPHVLGQNPVYYFGESVTVADTVMPDGKSLEHVGVQPDRVFLPTAADLAAGMDPVLAYAAGLAGVKITPEQAAKLFPPNESGD
jgi:carboxyl-terminal processing protease